jgi:hypothetical protein
VRTASSSSTAGTRHHHSQYAARGGMLPHLITILARAGTTRHGRKPTFMVGLSLVALA